MGKRKYHRKGQKLSIFEGLDWSLEPDTLRSVISIILILLGLVIFLGMFGLAGTFGAFFIRLSTDIWGILGYLIPFVFAVFGVLLLLNREGMQIKPMTIVGTMFILIFLPALIHPFGGGLGSGIRHLFESLVGFYAALILLFGLTLVAVLLTFNKSLAWLWHKIGNRTEEGVKINEPRASVFATLGNRPQPQAITSFSGRPWEYPSMDLLSASSGKANSGNINKNVEIISKTLADFGISVTMADVNVGPTVTQYTLKPAPAVKLNQITARANDLSLALAQHPIRIEAPVPGKSVVGVEIPNKEKAVVSLREVLEDEKFKAIKSNLTLGMGRDVGGHANAVDLKKMPHLLIAGATGSGKSVCINAMIISLLYQNSPEDLRLILVDPKRVEFTHYNGIPHLLCPVVFDVDKTVSALRWTVAEMDRRFRLLQETGRRNIEAYNVKPEHGKLPYIVIFIDELADLMAQAGNEVEAAIVRLSQMARAVGIHLVVATQRPSVDVITGLIKANITNRIAFAVASQIDSRTILDASGAEKLLGNGDMLYLGNEIGKPKRIQGVLIKDEDVDKVTSFLKAQCAPQYDESICAYHGSMEKGVGGGGEINGGDELYEDAKEVVVMAGKASASLLQRRLRIGYARAARLLDIMEENGVIGPAEGAKPRDVMIDPTSLDHERAQAHVPMNGDFPHSQNQYGSGNMPSYQPPSQGYQPQYQPQTPYQNNQYSPQSPEEMPQKPQFDQNPTHEPEDLGEYRR